jgi:hypothetical protein
MLTYLRLCERGLFNLILEGLGNDSASEHAVLAKEEPILESKLSERETDNELLPWEVRPVEPAGQTLQIRSQRIESHFSYIVLPGGTPGSSFRGVGVVNAI